MTQHYGMGPRVEPEGDGAENCLQRRPPRVMAEMDPSPVILGQASAPIRGTIP